MPPPSTQSPNTGAMLLSGQKRSRGSAALAAESRRALDSNSQRVSGSYNHPEGVAAAFIGRFGEAQPMAMGRPKTALVLDTELREQLESLANSRSLPAGLVRRAKIILLSASGKTNREVARQLETSKVTVSLWRCRFLKHGLSGLYEELRPGRPRPISDERVAQLVRKTLKTKP